LQDGRLYIYNLDYKEENLFYSINRTFPFKPLVDQGFTTVPFKPLVDQGFTTVPFKPLVDQGFTTVPFKPLVDDGLFLIYVEKR